MCGRYATTRSAGDLARLFAAFDETEGELAPDYNLAPTDPAPIVRESSDRGRVVSVARWGLLPVWADNPRAGARMINARSETVATAKAFAPSFKSKRCVVPADGWFEWVVLDGKKFPHFMTVPEGFAFAGLWAVGKFGLSCSIITTAAVGELARVHDRMPLLLEADGWERWLTAPPDPALLTPPSLEYVASIEIRPVGSAVGNVRNDGPELIARFNDPELQEGLF
jgi:putative SOS response-associated peptidase YedK